MPSTIELCDGTKAEVRTPDEVPEGKRALVVDASMELRGSKAALEAIQHAMEAGTPADQIGAEVLLGAGVDVDPGELMVGFRKVIVAVVLAFVKSWEYGPVTQEVLLDEVPGKVYDELRDALLPLYPQIVPNFKADGNVIGTSPTGVPIIDPKGPTVPSVA